MAMNEEGDLESNYKAFKMAFRAAQLGCMRA